MNEQEINQKIEDALTAVEAEYGVTILHAAESGSRAWGFASQDSDYDVRFIYTRPIEDYLRVSAQPDGHRGTITVPISDELDLHGWDLHKALRLIDRGNAAAIEWIYSPIRYRQHNHFHSQLVALIEQHFPTDKVYNHYSSLAVSNYKRHLEGKEQVHLKKYFYVLRAMFAAQWIKAGRGRPPVPFDQLLAFAQDGMPAEVSWAIQRALRAKAQTNETDETVPLTVLDQYIAESLKELPLLDTPEINPDLTSPYDQLRFNMLMEARYP